MIIDPEKSRNLEYEKAGFTDTATAIVLKQFFYEISFNLNFPDPAHSFIFTGN